MEVLGPLLDSGRGAIVEYFEAALNSTRAKRHKMEGLRRKGMDVKSEVVGGQIKVGKARRSPIVSHRAFF